MQLQVTAALVSPEDISMIRGESHIVNMSDYAGLSSVGKVIGVGHNVRTAKVGDHAVIFHSGAWADKPIVSSSCLAVISKDIPSEHAATFPIHIAAWAMLQSFSLKKGSIILQASPNTPVGASVSSIARHRGFEVLEPSEEELLNAAFMRNYRGAMENIVSGLGGKIGASVIRALGQNGKLISFKGKFSSLVEKGTVDIPMASTIFRGASVEGFDLYTWVNSNPTMLQQAASDIEKLLLENNFRLSPICFPLSKYQQAIQQLMETNGTVVIQW